jgi:hypothetical protein
MRRLLVSLGAMTLVVAPALRGQDAKEKEPAKAKEAKAAKAKDKPKDASKPPVRSYSDDDLKKYKDQPKDEGGEAQAGSAGESPAAAETVPGQRRSREYGGYQQLPPPLPAAPIVPPAQESTAPESPTSASSDSAGSSDPAEGKSPEEVEWKRQAVQARRPVEAAKGHIAQIESEMAGLKDQLNPMSTTYVLGGNSTAGPGAIYEVEEKLRNLESQRVDAKAELAEAEKGWQAFLEEARSAGANSAWLTP